jgi:RNA polymerase sigma-70 factor (ECF subfamily)
MVCARMAAEVRVDGGPHHDGAVDEVTRLALQARSGVAAHVAAFVRATQADVWRLCAHLVDRDAADDLTQETYLRALAAIGGFRGDASARTWVLTIARRTCADAIRGRRRRRALAARLEQREVHRRAVSQAPGTGAVELDLVLAGLDDDRRVAFTLTQVLGLSYAEAAAVCDCPVGTIRSRVARARADLAAALGGAATAASASG